MNNFCILYLFIYLIYAIFGYDIITRIINNKPTKIINFKVNHKCFCCRRLLQLSLITILVSAITLNYYSNLDINIYLIALLLNLVVIIFYLIKWYPFEDNLTFYSHVFWAIPIFLLPFFCKFNGNFDIKYILIIISLLLVYKMLFENYVYS